VSERNRGKKKPHAGIMFCEGVRSEGTEQDSRDIPHSVEGLEGGGKKTRHPRLEDDA